MSAETKLMSGGQAIVDALVRNGVDTVFGIPGVQLDPLFDAFYQSKNQIKVIHTRHEQGAGYMALGYAQATGKVGNPPRFCLSNVSPRTSVFLFSEHVI